MNPENVIDVTRLIQLAVAPVFLLTAVGRSSECSPTAWAARWTAAVRSRNGCASSSPRDRRRRARNSISSAGACAWSTARSCSPCCARFFVGLLIAVAFVDAFIDIDLSRFIGLLFIAAMLAFILALLVFLREIFLAVSSARNQMR